MNGEFTMSFDGWNGRVNAETAIASDQKRIDGGTNQFGIVILSRWNQFQDASRVASIHCYLYIRMRHDKREKRQFFFLSRW